MVSTRQMATSSGNGPLNHNSTAVDSARFPAIAAHTQRGIVGAPTISSIIATNLAAFATRQCAHHQNHHQLVKLSDTTTDANENTEDPVQLLDLPNEILAKIFAYVGYRKVGQLRVVSRKMNDVCMDILNSTFSRLITQTYNRFHAIKANMPRRESARRNHPLACECDIIETCYMRLSLLQMTFGKHIERGHCSFFPGAILDEVYNILIYIRNTPRLERPYRVTDELFDLSTMAMEYFRDRIEQTLPDIACYKDFYKLPTTTKRPALVASVDVDSSSTSPPQSNMVLRKGIRKIKQGMKIYNNQLSVLRNELRTCKRKSSEQGKQIAEQQKLLAEQQKQTLEYANRMDENDKKNEEMARKFSTLLQELNKCKTELQYWRSKSPAIPICTSCGQRLAPMLPPPEDFQALINQGVKPEDIILNLSDDTDIENDITMHDSNGTSIEVSTPSPQPSVFAFPDKETTTKLLAASSTVTKNQLKRQHFSASTLSNTIGNACNEGGSNSVFNIYATGSHNNSNSNCCNCQRKGSDNQAGALPTAGSGVLLEFGSAIDADDSSIDAVDQLLPSEMTNRLNYVRCSNIIRTTASNSHTLYNLQQEKQQSNALTSVTKPIGDVANYEPTGMTTPVIFAGNENAISTKLAQVGGRSHRSVIVSPAMLSATKSSGSGSSLQHGLSGACNAVGAGLGSENKCGPSTLLAGTAEGCGGCGGKQIAEETAVEHVVSLQGITSHETKKARRVQKTTRCLNGSGKRSK
ncbi:uncharacterized protein LOC129243795 [Anastrepha obliqua]|uniref:uncharacterized protein LOC129243795 n=1 Tax=Anastrepha obliqua TaxID=95512 RepID=UPI00240A10F8|nr:uncharacterized protein LOC129243795 [Anastrepha obliqua]XP_054737084.1 uncharacterized protein LOC129243795 [Anastrepha obliqua]XP_054737085.1 uncharacterized protein LOC129243795 [Anastrepha obliqua]XP_054737086.1 uncharacterized protein LOC129243795 [Anastrepha obliqua]XP_054737087.1 uncharacterized protein LOC129243795 [Anastrepha obliqua]